MRYVQLCPPGWQDAIGVEYTAMMAQLNALFAQQKALLTSISQPLPPPPGVDGDTSVVCAALQAPITAAVPLS